MVKLPTPERLREISASYNLDFSDRDIGSLLGLMEDVMASYHCINQLVEPALAEPPFNYPRSGGRRPEPKENPLGAWYYRCFIKGAPEGPLSGKRIAIRTTSASRAFR